MITVISRIFQYGLKSFWRNGWLSAATVAITVLALLVFSGLILFRVITDRATASIQEKIDISVYFKTNTSEDQILNIKQSVESLAEVSQVDYVSSDRALEIFKEKHKDDPTITQAVEELSTNPLQPSLNIRAKKPDQYAAIAQYLESPSLAAHIDSVSYAENQIVIDRLAAVVNSVNRGGLALIIFLAFVAGLVVFNTIRLAIYSNREEIGIMRVVGASNAFVRGPYVVEGVITGGIAAVVSLAIAAPMVYFVSPYLNAFIPGLEFFRYFYTNIGRLLLYQLLFGVLVGGFSSFIAVRRYLRN
ncbi:ABC transporter permease [Candidatus Parcubacteria bacterium]|nr:MAG: ABC transporter permease [Candidatus Parcubacteria bacterium]